MKLSSLVFAALLTGASAFAANFTQCPAVGNDTNGCQLLITVTSVSGGAATAFSVAVSATNQGPFDGSEDTLVGVQNSSGATLTSLSLSSSTDIFGFDGDGACEGSGTSAGYSPAPTVAQCGGSYTFTDPTDYLSAGETLTGVNAAGTSGTIHFNPGIADGGSGWFSLEEALTPSQIVGGTPEPGTLGALGAGLLGLFGMARYRRVKK